MAKKEYGDNVNAEIKGNKLLIEVDLTKDFGPSKSGKTITIGSTRGNARIYGDKNQYVIAGINIYKYPEEKE